MPELIEGLRPLDLVIGGAAKSGTTSLKAYFGQHPAVCTHAERGVNFFEESLSPQAFAEVYGRFLPCATDAGPDTLVVAKSVRLLYSATAQANLRRHNPRVHVAVVLRHPVDRAYSDYWYARRQGWESAPTFRTALEAGADRFPEGSRERERCAYIDRSLYARHLQRLMETFPRERIHVFFLDELHREPERVVITILERMDRDVAGFTLQRGERRNSAALPRFPALARMLSRRRGADWLRGMYSAVMPAPLRDRLREGIRRLNEREFVPPPLDSELRGELERFFRGPNRELEEILGRSLPATWAPRATPALDRAASGSESP